MDRFAAQLGALDAVVTISNTGAHLAGAMGIPTCLIRDDWFRRAWPVLSDRTPWYPKTGSPRKERSGLGIPVQRCEETARRLVESRLNKPAGRPVPKEIVYARWNLQYPLQLAPGQRHVRVDPPQEKPFRMIKYAIHKLTRRLAGIAKRVLWREHLAEAQAELTRLKRELPTDEMMMTIPFIFQGKGLLQRLEVETEHGRTAGLA